MTAKPVKIAIEADESDLTKSLNKAGGELDGFANDARAAGDKAERSLADVGAAADNVGSGASQAAGGLGDLGGALALMPGPLGAVGAGMEATAPAIMGVTGAADLLNLATERFPILAKAQAAATKALAAAQKALNLVMAGNPIALVVLAIVALIAIMATLYAKNERFRKLVDKVFGVFKRVVGEALDKMGAFLQGTVSALSTAGERFGQFRDAARAAIGSYSANGGGALGKVHDIVSAVTGLPGVIREKAAGLFGPVREAAANAIGTYSANGGGALGKLHDVVTAVTGIGGTVREKAAGMWDGISSSFKGVINNMIRWWNNLSFSIDIPDKIPGLPDSFTISTPNIPYLADGGVVTRATLAVVGEAGPEAVIPLDRLAALTGGRGGAVHFHLDGTFIGATRESVGRWLAEALAAYYSNGGARP